VLDLGDVPDDFEEHVRPTSEGDSSAPHAQFPVDDAATERWEVCRDLNLGASDMAAELDDAACRRLLNLSAATASAYLAGADLRRLNVAAKAFGVCWCYVNETGNSALRGQAAKATRLLARGTVRMRAQVTEAFARDGHPAGEVQTPLMPRAERPPYNVLAGSGSRGFARFVQLFGRHVELRSWCAFSGGTVGGGQIMYATAWTPPQQAERPEPPAVNHPRIEVADWQGVASWLSTAPAAQATLLFGMPVVPNWVLARSGNVVLNAHNGALPTMRGLDALAWSLALGEPPTATAHEVVARVDAGPAVAVRKLASYPVKTVSARLKDAQCVALAAALLDDTGRPVDTIEPISGARYFGRMHPLLRRVMDSVTLDADTSSSKGP